MCIVLCLAGGGALDKQHWQACKAGFFLPIRVLSRLFRRVFVDGLRQLFTDDSLLFYGELSGLSTPASFETWCTEQQSREWVVYAKRPFAGPDAVLAYLSRYTHRVAIANSRLLDVDRDKVTFKYKDYRLNGGSKHKAMTLKTDEFIRRFMLHVLPCGFHRIRHYGLLASKQKLAQARQCLKVAPLDIEPTTDEPCDDTPVFHCRECGQPMVVIAILPPYYLPRAPPNMKVKDDARKV
jgi:hypothetical protein